MGGREKRGKQEEIKEKIGGGERRNGRRVRGKQSGGKDGEREKKVGWWSLREGQDQGERRGRAAARQ